MIAVATCSAGALPARATETATPQKKSDADAGQELGRFEFTQIEMAVTVRIVLYSPDLASATMAAKDAFARIHALNHILSDYDPESELRKLCDTSGEGSAIHVSAELWKVLEHAQRVAERSDGAFDVTVGPIVRLWRRARRQKVLPMPEELQKARELVGYRFVRLDPKRQTVELLKKGMRLDLGGIAKGYAMDEALADLARHHVQRAMVEAGGDLRLGDPPPGRKAWRVGIPLLDEPHGESAAYLEIANSAVSTSGDLIQFVEIAGKRYSHVVDPRTGQALTDHCRVMVVGPEGMAADAISKAVGVLGPKAGLKLIDETPGLAAMVTRSPDGPIEHYESASWKDLRQVKLRKGE